MKVSVSLGPPLSVSAPVEVADLEEHRVPMWSVLPDGRFIVGLKLENEDEITRYELAQNWMELLNRKLSAARQTPHPPGGIAVEVAASGPSPGGRRSDPFVTPSKSIRGHS